MLRVLFSVRVACMRHNEPIGSNRAGRSAGAMKAARATVVALASVWGVGHAAGADAPMAASQFNWTGVYVGGHAGYARGDSRFSVFDPAVGSSNGSFGGL